MNATIVASGGGKRLTLGELDLAGVEKWVDHKKAQVLGERPQGGVGWRRGRKELGPPGGGGGEGGAKVFSSLGSTEAEKEGIAWGLGQIYASGREQQGRYKRPTIQWGGDHGMCLFDQTSWVQKDGP